MGRGQSNTAKSLLTSTTRVVSSKREVANMSSKKIQEVMSEGNETTLNYLLKNFTPQQYLDHSKELTERLIELKLGPIKDIDIEKIKDDLREKGLEIDG